MPTRLRRGPLTTARVQLTTRAQATVPDHGEPHQTPEASRMTTRARASGRGRTKSTPNTPERTKIRDSTATRQGPLRRALEPMTGECRRRKDLGTGTNLPTLGKRGGDRMMLHQAAVVQNDTLLAKAVALNGVMPAVFQAQAEQAVRRRAQALQGAPLSFAVFAVCRFKSRTLSTPSWTWGRSQVHGSAVTRP